MLWHEDQPPAPRPLPEPQPGEDRGHGLRMSQGTPLKASTIRPSRLNTALNTDANSSTGTNSTHTIANLSSQEGRIGRRMPRTSRRHYQRTPSRFARFVSTKVALRPLSVEALVHGPDPIQERFATLVSAARELRDAAMEARLLGPVRAVLAACQALPLDVTLIRTESAADLRDDQSRLAYLLALATDPETSRDELQQWLTDLDVSQGRLTELRAAIVGHLESEK